MKKRIKLILLMIVVLTGTATARDSIKFDHVFDLGVPGGQTCLQDNDGFLWIGTDGGGMFRYDGYDLKNYAAGPGLLSQVL